VATRLTLYFPYCLKKRNDNYWIDGSGQINGEGSMLCGGCDLNCARACMLTCNDTQYRVSPDECPIPSGHLWCFKCLLRTRHHRCINTESHESNDITSAFSLSLSSLSLMWCKWQGGVSWTHHRGVV
jgi:MinD superfamily P-loop ATPase